MNDRQAELLHLLHSALDAALAENEPRGDLNTNGVPSILTLSLSLSSTLLLGLNTSDVASPQAVCMACMQYTLVSHHMCCAWGLSSTCTAVESS